VAIARVQLGTAVTSTGTGLIAPAWPAATTVGNLLIAVICNSRSTAQPTLSVPGGSPWVLAVENWGTVAQETSTHVYYIANAASRSGSESSFTLSVARDVYGVVLEYSGVATSTPLDVSTSKNGAGVAATALATNTTGTTAQAAELILGAIASANADTSTGDAMGGSATGGTFAKLAEASSGSATAAQKVTGRVYEQLVTATGTAECHCTVGTARLYTGTVTTFKASGAAPTVYPPKPLIVNAAVDRSFSY
jgi:hypothetical protein